VGDIEPVSTDATRIEAEEKFLNPLPPPGVVELVYEVRAPYLRQSVSRLGVQCAKSGGVWDCGGVQYAALQDAVRHILDAFKFRWAKCIERANSVDCLAASENYAYIADFTLK
jgi:hypothetical protein